MKTIKISFRLQNTSTTTKPIQLVVNFQTIIPSTGNYARVICNTGLSINPDLWNSKINLPLERVLFNKLQILKDYTELTFNKVMLPTNTEDEAFNAFNEQKFYDSYLNNEYHQLAKECVKKMLYQGHSETLSSIHNYDQKQIFEILKKIDFVMKSNNHQIYNERNLPVNFLEEYPKLLTTENLIETKLLEGDTPEKVVLPYTPKEKEELKAILNKPIVKAGSVPFYKYIIEIGQTKLKQKLIKKTNEYDQLSKKIEEYDNELYLHQLNDNVLTDVISSFYETEKSIGNVGKRKKTLKSVLINLLEERAYKTLDIKLKSKLYSKVEDDTNHPYLTEEQLTVLLNLKFKPEESTLEYVRDLFYIAAYTGGIRFIDYKQLFLIGEKKVKGQTIHYIESKSTKNGKIVQIPLLDDVYKLLKKYDFIFKPISNKTFNELIKIICLKASEIDSSFKHEYVTYITDIKTNKPIVKLKYFKNEGKSRIPLIFEIVSAHTSRRSFCTNFYYHRKIDAQTVMSFSGHEDYDTFINYVKAGDKEKFDKFAEEVVLADRKLKNVI